MLVEHPQATFVLRVAGTSMVEHGIGDGDMIVVDRSIQARHGHIVVAVIEGESPVIDALITEHQASLLASEGAAA